MTDRTRLAIDGHSLSFVSTIATLGTAVDITLSDLRIESFHPVDEATEQATGALAASWRLRG